MEALNISGVEVLFPFKPYDIQLDYMKSVISCLHQKCNGLLESPTGTGKTLCLLCSTLGWLDSQRLNTLKQLMDKKMNGNSNTEISSTVNGWQLNKQLPIIIYSSRTHSQLAQACKELKRTSYKSYKAVVIGSRDQLCVNPDVMKLETISSKNQSCRLKILNNMCSYYRNYEEKVEKSPDFRVNHVFDIEDLVTIGQKNNCCPYYASRHLKQSASVVFAPYNYILDPQIRSANKLELENSVVIFDEGHNIEKMCEESVSTELRSHTFAVCIRHINSILEKLKQINEGTYDGLDQKDLNELQIESVIKLKEFVCELEMAIDSMIKKKKTTKVTHDTREIFDIMERSGLDVTYAMEFNDIMNKILMLLISCDNINASQSMAASAAFDAMCTFVDRLVPIKITTLSNYELHKNEFIKKFKIFSQKGVDIEEEKSGNFWNKKSSPNDWVLNVWCLSPSIGAKALEEFKIHSLIITSGTLAPIHSFELEMDIKFGVKLQNSHVIKENQLSIINISQSNDKIVLTSKYDNRDNLDYYRALGLTLIDVLKSVPKGVLLFFSSYTALNKCTEVWKNNNNNIWQKLNAVKQIFLEPRSKQAFNDNMTKYRQKIDAPQSNGAVFFGVFRGKLSEGIDLPDDYCRCVIMTGLPFPSVADPRVILKKQYLQESKSKLSPDGWYILQMKRALNQAIGRVIRHKDDYGAIVLLDSRFASLNDGLSKWVEKFIYKTRSFEANQNIRKLESFFACITHNSIANNNNKINENPVKPANNNNNIFVPKSMVLTNFKSKNEVKTWSSSGGFNNKDTILKAFQTTTRDSNQTPSKQKSIFDMLSNKKTETQDKNKSTNGKSIDVIDINESPIKKMRLTVPLKSISLSQSNEDVLKTPPKCEYLSPNTKLQSIIKSGRNSDKKVHWNEDRNTVVHLEPLVVDLDEDEIIDTKTVNTIQTDNQNNNSNQLDANSKETDSQSSDQLMQFWRKNGKELKDLFKGTDNFTLLCEA
ncbi:regulator of telomere elongation helicase 1 homolog, partial [Oppia nitens]|uniref:regulator of telomere elongation helicase 1 homolog n=1 Tax=Oppia nitens TaxID=1686743 RepID=UPI0023DC7E6F